MENFLKLIGIVIMAMGTICVYDARKLTQRFFSTSDTNTATKTFKIVGFLVAIIGSALVII